MDNFKNDLFQGRPDPSQSGSGADRQAKMIKLSPSSLNLFLECPRCFWLYINKEIKRPGSPVATITSGLDRVIKEYLNTFRAKNILPPFLEGKIPGRLMTNFPKKGWLEYPEPRLNAKLGGYLDECIQLDDQHYAVLDHKTRGSAPDSVHKAYQFQMDAYTFLLEANRFPTLRSAYLAYYIPKKILSGTDFHFEVLIKEIATDPKRAQEVFYRAIDTLLKPMPDAGSECEFCKWQACGT